MLMALRTFLVSILLTLITCGSAAAGKVGNFSLIDHRGQFHELDYYRRDPGTKAFVVFVQGNGCPLVRKRVPELKRLRDEFQPRGVLFAMLNANPQDGREDLVEEAADYGIDMPILKDPTQLVAGMLDIDRTGVALLIDARSSRVVFRGPIDDRLSYQSEKPAAENHYLRDAIQSILSGEPIAKAELEAPGCRITPESPAQGETISYSKQVAPILRARCVECHTRGGVGPFAMSNYRKVRGWSDMIAEVILTRQMPPWQADPHIGRFSNDSNLTDEEARTVVEWIRSGSPRGDGEDPLEGYHPPEQEWTLGTPDRVIDLPLQEIPAEGILDYRYAYVDSPFEDDVWIRASEVSPGNTRVVHHVIVTSENRSAERKHGIRGKWITGFAPGSDPFECPEDTGILLRKGHRLNFEIHYTVSGRPERDQTRLGLYLLSERPTRAFETGMIAHTGFAIPPHHREYAESYAQSIDHDIELYGVNPHMHVRGKRMSFTLLHHDGRRQPLVSVPNYNFNWQRTYHFAEPVSVKAGSRLLIEGAWDNSKLNPHNPDPAITVRWGDQTTDEMFFATYTYVRSR